MQQSQQYPSRDQMTLEDALEQVDKNADETWKVGALDSIHLLARYQRFLTSDDIWPLLACQGLATHEPRALGAMFRSAALHGWIKNTERVQKSRRKESHRRPIAIWESLIEGESW